MSINALVLLVVCLVGIPRQSQSRYVEARLAIVLTANKTRLRSETDRKNTAKRFSLGVRPAFFSAWRNRGKKNSLGYARVLQPVWGMKMTR